MTGRFRRPLAAMLVSLLLLGAAAVAGAGAPSSQAGAERPVRWLQRYIEIDTVNPPGNEAEAARFLAEILAGAGIEARLLESPAGRTSLYARLPASAPAAAGGDADRDGALVLMHHIDVVPAGDGWQVPPFSGRIESGRIWGRGAIDVKSLGIAQLSALVALARDGTPRHRDVVLLAVADEETGGGEGARWLLEAHPELFADAAGVINEGGANRVVRDRLWWWGIEIAQKRPLWLRLRAQGRGGHGSAPILDSATHALVRGLARLLERPAAMRVDPVVRHYLGAMARLEGATMQDLFARLDELVASGQAVSVLPPPWLALLIDTVQVTRIDTTDSINVIPAEATGYIDIRLLPDTDADAFLAALRALLEPRLAVDVMLESPPSPPSPLDHPLYATLESVLGVRGPVVPAVIAGVTDARYFRQRGIATYGLNPFSLEPQELRGVHAVDESIPVDEFERGVELMARIVRAWVADQGAGTVTSASRPASSRQP